LFDHFGKGFTLLRFNPALDTSALERAASQRGIPLTVLDNNIAEARELYGRDLALIRPDHYIAWRGDALPDDVDALLAKATGQ
jgi:hypothetical protein